MPATSSAPPTPDDDPRIVELRRLIEYASPEQRRIIANRLATHYRTIADRKLALGLEAAGTRSHLRPFTPLPHQTPPDTDWRGWLLLGGRGSGKSAAATRWLTEHINGPPCDPNLPGGHRGVIIAPTLEDGVISVFHGPSGIRSHDPTTDLVTVPGGTVVRFANTCEIPIIGAHNHKQADRVRARGNTCCAMIEEAAAVPALEEALDNLELGLRVGPNPRWVASTTPKPRKILRTLVADPQVAVTSGTIHDNPHLDEAFRRRMADKFAGTRKEAQELLGILLDEVVGALWSLDALDRGRLRDRHPDPLITIVGVDPAGSTSESADETGIVVVDGWLDDGNLAHVGVVADYTTPGGDPKAWTAAAVQAALDYGADTIVAEVNFGGAMVKAVLKQRIAELDLTNRLRVAEVRASRGKKRRAEPVAMLWDPTPPRGHIIGRLPDLESQLCTWTEDDTDSPDRLDALVWASTAVLESTALGAAELASTAAMSRRPGR